jgi:hypothetical protein
MRDPESKIHIGIALYSRSIEILLALLQSLSSANVPVQTNQAWENRFPNGVDPSGTGRYPNRFPLTNLVDPFALHKDYGIVDWFTGNNIDNLSPLYYRELSDSGLLRPASWN